jgi:hypothetical protein
VVILSRWACFVSCWRICDRFGLIRQICSLVSSSPGSSIIGGTHGEYLDAVKKIVNIVQREGTYVVIDMHQFKISDFSS